MFFKYYKPIKMRKKQAVVIIHGIGNQYPLETAKEFVENILGKDDLMYSSPDKIADFYETRRLSISKKNVDFYEYYWANLMSEPSTGDLYSWIFKLLFGKTPSERVKNLVHRLRFWIIFILITVIYISTYFWGSFNEFLSNFLKTAVAAIVSFVIVRLLIPRINSTVSKTAGDAVKYLTPSPQNISARFEIRNKGINLIRKLHEQTTENGHQKYDRIIIIGHSLGSVVAYDIISNLWNEFQYKYKVFEQHIEQPAILKMRKILKKKHQNNEFDLNKYRETQGELFKEIKRFNNPWLISDFITLGSPLCHGDFILAKNKAAFDKKINYREYPISPPKIELKPYENPVTRKKSTIKNYKFPFFFNKTYYVGNTRLLVDLKVVNHSSPFSFIKWTNIFFKNDYVGGKLTAFGDGILNHELTPNGGHVLKKWPFFSHTKYWDKKQKKSIDLIKDIIFKGDGK